MRLEFVSDQGISFGAIRSAAPAFLEALKEVAVLTQKYWDNGHLYDDDQTTRFGNPTLLLTLDESLTLHYGTEPLLGYHLAAAYVPLASGTKAAARVASMSKVVGVAQEQFSAWSLAFRKRSKNTLTIRFVQGDALAVSMAFQGEGMLTTLQHQQYNNPWVMEPLLFDNTVPGTAPSAFDVIDTSNLIDNLGSLNIMVATRPLLKNCQTSILYTEVLVQYVSGAMEMLADILCGDFATVSLLLGLAPPEYLTNASMISNMEEGMFDTIATSYKARVNMKSLRAVNRYRTRLCWRHVATNICLPPSSCAHFLLGVYQKMFQHEDLEANMSSLHLEALPKLSIPNYTRASYAHFLMCIKHRNQSRWDAIMEELIAKIENDVTLAISRCYLQELYLFLHLLDLRTLSIDITDVMQQSPTNTLYPFSKWNDIPSVIALTFEIPRRVVERLLAVGHRKFETPSLACALESLKGQHEQWFYMFSAIQVSFGSVQQVNSPNQDDYALVVTSDLKTWKSQNPMIVSFLAPTGLLLQDAQFCQVVLQLQRTTAALSTFQDVFPNLRLFETTSGCETVYLTKHMPNLGAHPMASSTTTVTVSEPTEWCASQSILSLELDDSCQYAAKFRHKSVILDQAAKEVLRLRTTEVVITNETVTGMNITIGNQDFMQHIEFPIPVQLKKSLLRVARQSGYIEVVVPLANIQPNTRQAFFTCPVQVSKIKKGDSNQIVVFNWNAPYVAMDQMPIIDTVSISRLQWLDKHLTLMFSARERRFLESPAPSIGGRAGFKNGLICMFTQSSGLRDTKAKFFNLYKEDGDGMHVSIFVSHVRLDLANHTVILDAAVLPPTGSTIGDPVLQQVMAQLPTDKLCSILISSDEIRMWKAMLPAFIERSRTWAHNPQSCDYLKHKSSQFVQTDREDGKSSFCACGQGKFPHNFLKDSGIPALGSLLLKYATRAAISPCFAIPYVEECFPNITSEGLVSLTERAGQGSNQPMPATPHCHGCYRTEGVDIILRKCNGCKITTYCSADCQKLDWKWHKKLCRGT